MHFEQVWRGLYHHEITPTNKTLTFPFLKNCHAPFVLDFFKDFIYLLLERGGGREKERERNINVREKYRLVASHMRPDQQLNRQPFTLREDTQPMEPHQSGHLCPFSILSLLAPSNPLPLSPGNHNLNKCPCILVSCP